MSSYILPGFIFVILVYALYKKVNAYEMFLLGVKDGLKLFMEVYPTMLAMLFAIAFLKKSGVIIYLSSLLSNFIKVIPHEVWPMILFRPLSGNATLAMLVDIIETCGIDSIQASMASMIEGATDTTLYVITLYFGSVGINKIANALSLGLLADLIGVIIAVVFTYLYIQ